MSVVGQVSLFGPVSFVTSSGQSIALRSIAHRRLIAILAIQPTVEVRSEWLCDVLSLAPPALRTSVSRLRDRIDTGAITTGGSGYRLDCVVDTDRFERLVVGSREAADRLQVVSEALDLWTAGPLDEFSGEEWARPFVGRLMELRMVAIEDRSRLLMAVGRADEAIAQLREHVSNNRFSDRGQGLLIEALAQVGRQTEALRSYQDYRDFLIEETGNEPSAAVQEIERNVAAGTIGLGLGVVPNTPQAPRPTGAVTFVFTDIESSTRLWEEHPEQMQAAVEMHDHMLRAAIEDADGYVFSTAGDSFAAAFSRASDALSAALAAQAAVTEADWPEATPIRVRMGVHTGEAQERDGDYFGPAVNRGARITNLGHGGQILVSATTAALSGDERLRDLGEYMLKDLQTSQRIYQFGADNFSALRGAKAGYQAGNLPAGTSGFVGRVHEIDTVRSMLAPGAVLTIVGIGGAGKTELATRVALAAEEGIVDGAWWVDLAALSNPTLIPTTVASMLGIMFEADSEPVASLADALARRELILVFDNCEHLLDDVAKLVEVLIERCPNVTMLATSREPLRLAAEKVWPIRPLSTDVEAVELLLSRAAAGNAAFDTSEWAAEDVEDLCARLDGIPLAIEMAAARLRSLSPRQVVDRIDDRFRLLHGNRRGPERHRSLAATLDWSYALLDASQQHLLDRLSVFASLFDLVAAEAVCADEKVEPAEIADLIADLVDKSLVVPVATPDLVRYRLLETVRDYGAARLHRRAELTTFRLRHCQHFAQLVATAAPALIYSTEGAAYRTALTAIDFSWADILAALAFAIDGSEARLVEVLLNGLGSHVTILGRREVAVLAQAALELPDPPPITYAIVAFFADGPEQIRLCEIGLTYPDLDWHVEGMLYSLLSVGRATLDHDGRLDAVKSALDAVRRDGSPGFIASWEAIHAEIFAGPNPDLAAEYSNRAHDQLARMNDHPLASVALGRLANYEARRGNFDAAAELAAEALKLSETGGSPVYRDFATSVAARLQAAQLSPQAAGMLSSALRNTNRTSLWFYLGIVLSDIGNWFAATGRHQPAAVVDAYFEANARLRHFDLVPRPPSPETPPTPVPKHLDQLDRDELVTYVLDQLAAAQVESG